MSTRPRYTLNESTLIEIQKDIFSKDQLDDLNLMVKLRSEFPYSKDKLCAMKTKDFIQCFSSLEFTGAHRYRCPLWFPTVGCCAFGVLSGNEDGVLYIGFQPYPISVDNDEND